MEKSNKNGYDDIQMFIKAKEKEYGLKISLIRDEDAEFICNLRKNFKARHLNGSVEDASQQVAWIHEYKFREERGIEFYFIFWSGSVRIGTIRFIKMDESVFESGSWLFIDDIPFQTSVKAELFCKDFAFEYYNFENCYFYMNKNNKQVIRYHTLFHPIKIKEDENHLYFTLNRKTYFKNRNRVLSYCQIN